MYPHPSDYTLEKTQYKCTNRNVHRLVTKFKVFHSLSWFFYYKKIHYHTTNSSFHIENVVGARESALEEYSSTMCAITGDKNFDVFL